MDKNLSNHILAEMGILTSFNIAKKFSHQDIKRITDKVKNSLMRASSGFFNTYS